MWNYYDPLVMTNINIFFEVSAHWSSSPCPAFQFLEWDLPNVLWFHWYSALHKLALKDARFMPISVPGCVFYGNSQADIGELPPVTGVTSSCMTSFYPLFSWSYKDQNQIVVPYHLLIDNCSSGLGLCIHYFFTEIFCAGMSSDRAFFTSTLHKCLCHW